MNIKYKTIRQVRITAPRAELGPVFDWIAKNDYSIRASGPVSLGRGKFDRTRILVIGEKQI